MASQPTVTPWAAQAASYAQDPSDEHFRALAASDIDDDELVDQVYAVAATRSFEMPVLQHLCTCLMLARHLAEAAWLYKQLEAVAPTEENYRLGSHIAALRADGAECVRINNALVAKEAPLPLLALTAELAYLVLGDTTSLGGLLAEVNAEHLAAESALPSVHLQSSLRVRHASAAVLAVLALGTNGQEVDLGKRQLDQLTGLFHSRLVQLLRLRTNRAGP